MKKEPPSPVRRKRARSTLSKGIQTRLTRALNLRGGTQNTRRMTPGLRSSRVEPLEERRLLAIDVPLSDASFYAFEETVAEVGPGAEEAPSPSVLDDTLWSFDGLWEKLDPLAKATAKTETVVLPQRFEMVALHRDSLTTALADAPLEFTAAAESSPLVVTLPAPDGTFDRFEIVDSPVMAPELAAKFPQIRSYSGRAVDDPTASLRFSVSPDDFHAQVLSPSGAYYIDPYVENDAASPYISYYRRDLPAGADRPFVEFGPEVEPSSQGQPEPSEPATVLQQKAAQPGELRTYRIAVAATGEYTAKHSAGTPTVADGLAAINDAINRVTGIYERDLAIRLQLVANNNLLVFTDPATDGYTNSDANALLSENQAKVDSIIGGGNYDIGHVFSTAGGGLAALGVVGKPGRKARGETGTNNPTGDAFWVDYVAHEIGHQFGAHHTWNGTVGECTSANHYADTAMEPFSGSTIMGYANICGPAPNLGDNLQGHSDPYFHSISLEEILDYVDDDIPNVGTRATTGNHAPIVDAGPDYTIPARTPFELTATSEDANPGDVLTYTWEQRNTGSAQGFTGVATTPDNGESPLFRSFLPSPNPTRTFPQLVTLLAKSPSNTPTKGERLPTVNWGTSLFSDPLEFRVTARDNFPGGGGVGWDDMEVTVVDTGAPFQVTGPSSMGLSFTGGTTLSVTWDVAGTTSNGIDAANVNILLSLDGGNIFSRTMRSDTPNDGSEDVRLPNLDTATARIKVQGSGNVFFDVSDFDFTITAGSPGNTVPAPGEANPAKPVAIELSVTDAGGLTDSTAFFVTVTADPTVSFRFLGRISGSISRRGSITLDIASLYIPGGVSSFEVEKPSTGASSLCTKKRGQRDQGSGSCRGLTSTCCVLKSRWNKY